MPYVDVDFGVVVVVVVATVVIAIVVDDVVGGLVVVVVVAVSLLLWGMSSATSKYTPALATDHLLPSRLHGITLFVCLSTVLPSFGNKSII